MYLLLSNLLQSKISILYHDFKILLLQMTLMTLKLLSTSRLRQSAQAQNHDEYFVVGQWPELRGRRCHLETSDSKYWRWQPKTKWACFLKVSCGAQKMYRYIIMYIRLGTYYCDAKTLSNFIKLQSVIMRIYLT